MHGEDTSGEGKTEESRVRESESGKEGGGGSAAVSAKKPSYKLLSKLGLPSQTSSTTTLTQKLNVNRNSQTNTTSQAPPSLAALLGVNKRPNQKAQSPAPSQNNKAAMCKPWSLVVKDPLWASSASTTATPQAQPPSSAGGSAGGTPENVSTEMMSAGSGTIGGREVGGDRDAVAVGPTLNEAALAARREKKQAPPFGALETPSLRLSETVSGRVGDILDIEESRRGWKGGSRNQPSQAFGSNRLTAAAAAISAFTPGSLFLNGGNNSLFKTPSSWAPFPSKKTSQAGGGSGEGESSATTSEPSKTVEQESEPTLEQPDHASRLPDSTEPQVESETAPDASETREAVVSGTTTRPSASNQPAKEAKLLTSHQPSNQSSRGSTQSMSETHNGNIAPKESGSSTNASSNRWLAAGNFLNSASHMRKSGMPNRQSSLVHMRGNKMPPEDLAATYAQAGRYIPPSMRNKANARKLAEDPPTDHSNLSSAQVTDLPDANRKVRAETPSMEDIKFRDAGLHTEHRNASDTASLAVAGESSNSLRPLAHQYSILGRGDDEVPPPPFSPPPVVSFQSQNAAVVPSAERQTSHEFHSPPPSLLKGSPTYESFEVAMDGWPRWMDAALNNAPQSRSEHTSSTMKVQSSVPPHLKTLPDEATSADWRHPANLVDAPAQSHMYGIEDTQGIYSSQPSRTSPSYHQAHQQHQRRRLSSSESGGGAGTHSTMVLNHVEAPGQVATAVDHGQEVIYPSQSTSRRTASSVAHPTTADSRSVTRSISDMSQLVLPLCQVHPGLTAWASKRVQPTMSLQSNPLTPPAAAASPSPPPSADFDVETSMHVSASHHSQPSYHSRTDGPSYNPRADALRYTHFMDSLPSTTPASQILQPPTNRMSSSRYFDHHPPPTHHSSMSQDPVYQAAATSRQIGADVMSGSRRVSPPSLFFGSAASSLQFERPACFFPPDGNRSQQPSLRYVDAVSTPTASDTLPLPSWNATQANEMPGPPQFHPDLIGGRSTWCTDPPESATVPPTSAYENRRHHPRCDDPPLAHSPLRATNIGSTQNTSMQPNHPQSALGPSASSRAGLTTKIGDKPRYKMNKRNTQAALRGGHTSSTGLPPRTTLASTAAAIAQLNKTHKTSVTPISADPTQ